MAASTSAIILALATAPAAATPTTSIHSPAPSVVIFPGAVRSVPAPDGSGARIFYRPHVSSDGSQASPVLYDNGRGRVWQVAVVSRSMGLGWSPDGRRAFLQDNWGSNTADCYVLTRTPSGVTGLSLLKFVQRTPGHPTESPSRAHYYVHCDGWSSRAQIIGAVSGHTDASPSHAFNHRFTYDAGEHHIVWGQ